MSLRDNHRYRATTIINVSVAGFLTWKRKEKEKVCLIHVYPLVFNEVKEANSAYRFNFITAGEPSFLPTEQEQKKKRKLEGDCIPYFQTLLSIRKARFLICSIHNRIHLKHL